MTRKTDEEWITHVAWAMCHDVLRTSDKPCENCLWRAKQIVAAIRKEERERCAEVCVKIAGWDQEGSEEFDSGWENASAQCATNIRALEEKP